jgi:signal transduction histidine kinase
LLFTFTGFASAEKQVSDLTGEDRDKYDQFQHLLVKGSPEDFYAFVAKYEVDLQEKGYMMLYYKLKTNKGFFALAHNMLYRAIKYAEELDNEVRKAEAKDYYYLPTGLYGDIYKKGHDMRKAKQFFLQALEEVGDRDPKFTLRMYMNLAEMSSLSNPDEALQWLDKYVKVAKQIKSMDHISMSLGMKAYICLLKNDKQTFEPIYAQYMDIKKKHELEINNRYDNIVDVAKHAFDGNFSRALYKIHEGNLIVDSTLCVICVDAMEGDIKDGFQAIKNHYVEMDSIYSLVQAANFNQFANETSLMRSQEETMANKRLTKQLINWLIGMTVTFLFVYIMGRRRLMKKIWARSKELKMALARAEESDRMKTEFIQSMSHEIRTPLNAVAGFAQVLSSPDFQLSDQDKKKMQGRIKENVDVITSVVNELLELSQSESETVMTEVEKSDIKCNELCRSVLESMKGREKPTVELRFSTNVDDTFTIRSNAYRLRSTLNHLIDNAQKFTDMGHIDLRFEHKGNEALFSVTDTGVGIDKKDRDRIFEDFYKLNNFKSGIGLGLPLCRRLIASIGGTVDLDPVYTSGSRFVITLPME